MTSLLPLFGDERPERADAAANREKVLAAAAALFERCDPATVSMDAVAAEAGVGKGTLFRRFGDRASLARALLSVYESEFQEGIIRGPAPLGPGAPPLAAPDGVRRRRTWSSWSSHGALLRQAEGSHEAFLASGVYAFYRMHVRLLLDEAGLGARAEFLADVVMFPLAATAHAYFRGRAQPLAPRARRRSRGPLRAPPILIAMSAPVVPASVEEVADGLQAVGYLPGESTALVAYLAARLGKPVLVEGPAGVGKTELAKAMAKYLQRDLVRLQCYEGLDEAKALYEWNYRKQLLRIQAEAEGTGWQAVQDDIFGEEFLLSRPLMQAIASPVPVVLLIDEIDKTDQEFEAMLLELLSDFQISIPELGRIEARTHPVVLLTSNNSRELTEALKRRCLYLWLDYPTAERELEIVRLHAPELPETVARRLVEVIAMVRELDLKKPPSIAESIDWARALLLLGAQDIDQRIFRETLSIIVKHRTDLDTVAERVGVRLGAAA